MGSANGTKSGSVMVVGAGIAGMQSALDLANSRWRAWLAAKATPTDEGQIVLGPETDAIDAESPTELIEELTR